MTDSDFNSIKPVDNLHNIQGLTPAQQQKERKRQQRQQKQPSPQETKQEPANEAPEEQATDGSESPHKIDYCA